MRYRRSDEFDLFVEKRMVTDVYARGEGQVRREKAKQ